MAIISIPSSIGGVAIPGLTNVPGGPLGVLFGGADQLSIHQYPRDLGSATKGHAIKFDIQEIEPINYSQSGKNSNLGNAIEGLGQRGNFMSAVQGFKEVASSVGDFLGNVGGGSSLSESFNIELNKRKTKTVATIALYMPETMAFQYGASYGKASLVNTLVSAGASAANLAGKKGKAISSFAEGALKADATKLILATQGLALNPQEQILFDGIDFRTYTLAFTFTPYSREEAKQVKDIIKLFRQYAAPRIKPGAAGMFFIPPGTFKLKFLYNGKENTNITKVGESVIESIDVNYAPNGWSTHSDGAPVQTTLTMTFKETQLVDRTQIEKGY
jgi:hypothetical protein